MHKTLLFYVVTRETAGLYCILRIFIHQANTVDKQTISNTNEIKQL